MTVCATSRGYASASDSFSAALPRVRVVEMSIDDAWLRDTGPIFVEEVHHDASSSVGDSTDVAPNATVAGWRRPRASCTVATATDGLSKRTIGLCFTFDAWGGYCYDDWTNDALVGRKVCGIERLAAVPRAMVLEGGAVSV